MGRVEWSELPPNAVDLIAKRFRSDIDLLRLKSVCSSWRSSVLPPPPLPYTLPLKIPPIRNELHPIDGKKGAHYTLHHNTLYRLSPTLLSNQDWLLKVTQTDNPHRLSLLKPLSKTDKLDYPPHTIPNYLNLLDYSVSEVCRSYKLKGRDHRGSSSQIVVINVIKKFLPLWNYVLDCGFAALGLENFGELRVWKVGDEAWTRLDTQGLRIQDMIFYDGVCYAVDSAGVLVCFDSQMQVSVVAAPADDFAPNAENVLLECESDLYVVSKVYRDGPGFFEFYEAAIQPETLVNVAIQPETLVNVEVTVCKFNKSDEKWDCIGDLKDKVFLLGKDLSVGVSAKDFQALQGNCVYLTDWDYTDEVYGDMAGIYHMDNPAPLRIAENRDLRPLNWHPPTWIMPTATSSRPSLLGCVNEP